MQCGAAATTIVFVLDFFGGFVCLKAFGVARVRLELCDAEATPSKPFLECEALLAATFKVRGRISMQTRGFIFKTGSSEPTRLLKYDLSN
jgi:hypothetical protein